MARLEHLETRVSTRAVAGILSVVLHVGLFLLVMLSGGRQDGVHDADTPTTQVVMLESRIADQNDGVDLPPLESAVPVPTLYEPPDPRPVRPPSPLLPDRVFPPAEDNVVPPEDAEDSPPVEIVAPAEPVLTSAISPLSTFVMPPAEASALLQRVERLAEEHANAPRTQLTWDQDGRQYNAELVLERARNGVELDRIIAEISAEDRGMELRTRITLKRLPFSHFTQVVDRWDPMVQMHDDEIVGRMHINSRFNVLYDAQARPKVLGKVSTSARGVNMQSSSHGRESDVFQEGIETGAGRIALSKQAHSLEWARRDTGALVHELANDTHIRFSADGSYSLLDRKSGASEHRNDSAGQAVYFIAARGAKVYVQGVVAGKFFVFSPQKVVVEGNLRYARDPRDDPDSGDYLGLVCDRDIEVASPRVTGPGDLHIHAALFAKRRFVVTNIDHRRSATMYIYGSLAAGSLTASEPRYATKVEYDRRFEKLRPPGFPSTDRFAAEDWDGRWIEVPEQTAAQEQQ
jgi:hypothetical protein